MKKRIITGVVGGLIIIAWLFLLYTPVFPLVLAALSGIAEYEMLKAFKVKNTVFGGLCIITAISVPLYFACKTDIKLFPLISVIILVSLIIMVADFKNLKFEQVTCSLFSAALIPSALSCLILFRDVYLAFPLVYKKNDGIFFILFALFASLISDTFALFTGMAFGKHKLAPEISPKKTVEGAVGGIAAAAAANIILYFVFKKFFALSASITLTEVIVFSILLAVIGIFGDLAASTVKRHSGIKDFGNILPGHGGIMDRIDSCIFVFAGLYSIIAAVNMI